MSELYQDNNDELTPSLSYKTPNTASYIISRKSSTFHCVGGNIYTPGSGARLIKFYLSGEDFLDPHSLRIQFDLVSTEVSVSNKHLMPIGGPHGFFSRCRVLARGEVIDDITEFNRVSEMFSFLKAMGQFKMICLNHLVMKAIGELPRQKSFLEFQQTHIRLFYLNHWSEFSINLNI